MGRTGFEPVKAEPADLQSAPFDRFGTYPEEERLSYEFGRGDAMAKSRLTQWNQLASANSSPTM